jgi:hypothetical protein
VIRRLDGGNGKQERPGREAPRAFFISASAGETPAVQGPAKQGSPSMLIGLFLLYLAAFIAVIMSIQWLSDFLVKASTIDSITFIAGLGGATAILILARVGHGGVTIAVAIMVFWALLLFGVDYVTVTTTIDVAATVLCAAAAAILSESLLRSVTGK